MTAVPAFVKSLYDMISSAPPAIASWVNEGRSFAIKEPKAFAMTILPKYFKHNSFNSFLRQLSFYGFQKSKHDETPWHFHHRFFQQDKPYMITQHQAVQDLRSDLVAVKMRLQSLQVQTTSLVKVIQGLFIHQDGSLLPNQQGVGAVQASSILAQSETPGMRLADDDFSSVSQHSVQDDLLLQALDLAQLELFR
ncbi:hypothetical protein LEN26_001695 [Aphanomyces euteiches]|nr:hypothetical protein AeMF1_005886 [Aphanomyces euteiches]KAH9160826.1 hypothetical protein LEN26_001695 [Aphanomyces euteiches]KAH9187390.1 hypothetical protein AeNC1_010636 [Aphanomyces euteiches]